MKTTLALWIFVSLVGFCAFLWALDATVMARLDRIRFEEQVRDIVPMVPQGSREAWA